MAILLSSPVTGSIKVQNTSASPQSLYLTNLQTVSVIGDPFQNAVVLQNSNGQNIATFPLSQITRIAASTQAFGIQFAVDSVAALIMK